MYYSILTCYYRSKPGGFCKRLFRGIQALLDHGHTVHYLAVVPFPIEHPNCHFHRFPWPKNYTSGYLFWGIFHLLAPILLLYVGFRYKINRLFAFGHSYSLFLQPLRVIKHIPLTLFLRGDTLAKHKTTGRPDVLIKLEHYLEGIGIAGTKMYGVSRILTNKVSTRHVFLQPKKIGILRNDIPQYAVIKRAKCIQFPLRVASVGMLEPGKNQRFLINIFKKIPREKAHLYLYGTGPDEKSLQKVVQQEKMSDQIHFMGWVQPEYIWPEVDLLLMPSLHEGAPNAVLEALGHEIAVLASNIPEHAEILPMKYLCSLDDIKEWEKRIKSFIDSSDARMQEFVREQKAVTQQLTFDWEINFVRCVV